MSIHTKFKRVLSGVLSLAMAASILPSFPVIAEETTELYPYTMFAASDAEGAITINSNNFSLNGNIATNGTIVSSGNMNINGSKTENANEEMIYILKKLNYSYFSGDNVDIYADDYSYEDLNININDPMDVYGSVELTGNISLSSGIKAFEDVQINGEVKNTSEAVICSETGDIVITSTNVNFSGLIYAPYGDIIIDTDNLNLNNVIIIGQTITIDCPSINVNNSRNMAELVGTESDVNVRLYAFGEYNDETNCIDIEWEANYTNSSYEVWCSDDNVNYTSVSVVSDEMTYQYPIVEDFDIKYFKVSLTTNYGEAVESIPFVVTRDQDGYIVDYLDSDGDGLPDIYEDELGTDVNKVDTDEDGLTDYQEVFVTGTDPTKYDSVTEGVSDADADCDGDGLSNAQEIALGTNPRNVDTDKDGLSDYEEIYVYGTDPLNPDTDEDGVNDGDEIILTLNPLNPDTDGDGTLDCDEYFEQTVDESRFDNDLFENNLAVPSSLVVSAKGNVNSNIDISEYTGYLKGEERVYVGKVIEITNSDINYGKLTFTLDDDYVIKSYETGGESTNGLLICYNDGNETIPLPTVYDEEARTLSAEINSEGIYFILDVMSWLESLGLDMPTETISNQPKIETFSASSTSSNIGDYEIKGQVDIVFVVDTTGSMSGYIDNVKNNITAFVKEIEAADIIPYFALVEYRDITCDGVNSTNAKTNSYGSIWFKNADDFKSALSQLSVNGGGDELETPIDGLEFARRLDLRASSQKFFILVTDVGYKPNNNYRIETMDEMIELLIDDKINVSVVSNSSCESTYKSLYKNTGGVFANVGGNFKDELLTIADLIDEETNNGYWIALKGLVPQIVKLDEKPSLTGTADTDGDTLLDREELKSVLPTEHFNLNDFIGPLLPEQQEFFSEYPVINAYEYYSNPVKEDSDGDGIIDYYTDYIYPEDATEFNLDNRPLEKGYYSTEVEEVVIGEITIVSCSNFPTGHAFLVYQSSIDDVLDFTGLTGGYEYMSWIKYEPCHYVIYRDEYVSIGNAGQGVGGSSQPLESGSTGIDGDEAGIFFNREFAVEKNNYDNKYNKEKSEKFNQKYDKNQAYTKLITADQLDIIIEYCSEKNYYNLFTNNCAEIAATAWNKAFDTDDFDVKMIPNSLKNQIKKLDGSFVFNMYDVLGVEI